MKKTPMEAHAANRPMAVIDGGRSMMIDRQCAYVLAGAELLACRRTLMKEENRRLAV